MGNDISNNLKLFSDDTLLYDSLWPSMQHQRCHQPIRRSRQARIVGSNVADGVSSVQVLRFETSQNEKHHHISVLHARPDTERC